MLCKIDTPLLAAGIFIKLRVNTGFTLIEVVIALAIVSVALLAIFKSGSDAAQLQIAQRDRVYTQWVANNLLAEVQLAALSGRLSSVARSGTQHMGGSSWNYSIKIETTAMQNLNAVTIEILDPLTQKLITSASALARSTR